MKFKIEEFFSRFAIACALCGGIIILREQDYIGELIAGIILVIISILGLVVGSSDFEVKHIKHKSKLEKAEEKAIKYKNKLEDRKIKQKLKEYKLLKKEIFKCIIKSDSMILIPSSMGPILAIKDKLNCDRDFRGLHFSVYENRIYWERIKND